MAFAALEARLHSLGIVPFGVAFQPIAREVWQPIEAAAGGHFPDVLQWLFDRFGGFKLEEVVLYDAPGRRPQLFGSFLSGPELAEAYDNTRDCTMLDEGKAPPRPEWTQGWLARA